MSRIQLIFQNYQEKITLAFCLIVSLLLIFNNDSDLIKNAKINSLNSFSFLYQPFNWLDNQLFLNKKLEVLSSENLRLSLENQVLKVHETENIRYREFLNFKRRENLDFVGADVISKGVNANMSSIIINRGSNDGVSKNLPVLSSNGVIGKITAVSSSTSEVQLISDVNFRLSVKIAPDEVEGIMRWVSEDICEIAELKKISDIEIGDIVLTSNLSIYFPPNLPVGEVVSIFEKSDSSNRIVTMKLFSDLSTINQLFVLLNEDVK
ncbi:MAG: rod shape-determining protein MreC [Candidatus Marinimicrobia bacterium]|nr:rod shape-determining protein MreC [Candidatus Neomarinimicrobiota bacterium]